MIVNAFPVTVGEGCDYNWNNCLANNSGNKMIGLISAVLPRCHRYSWPVSARGQREESGG